MKKTRKRGLAWLMALAMVVSLLPMTVWADPLEPGPSEPTIPVYIYLFEDASLENRIYDHEYSDKEMYLPFDNEGKSIHIDVEDFKEGIPTIKHEGETYEIAGFMSAQNETPVKSLTIPYPPEYEEDSKEYWDWAGAWSDGVYIVYLPEGTSIGGGSRDKTDYYNITATIEAFDAEGNFVGYKPLGKITLKAGGQQTHALGYSDDYRNREYETSGKIPSVREETTVELSIELYEGDHDYEFKGWALKENAAADAELDGETETNFELNRNMDMVAVFVEKAPKEESGYVIKKDTSFDYGELKVTGGDFVYIPRSDSRMIVLFEEADYHVTMDKDTEVAKEEFLYLYDVDMDITLDNVQIERKEFTPIVWGCEGGNEVNLILKGENRLTQDWEELPYYRKISEVGFLLDAEDPGSLTVEGEWTFDEVDGKLMHDDIYVLAGENEEAAKVVAKGAGQEFDGEYNYLYIAGADHFEYFDFNNSTDKFFNYGEVQNYDSGKLFDWFEKRMEENGISSGGKLYALMRAAAEAWGGSCFGFSAVAAMFHEEEMSLNELNLFDEDAEDLPTTTEPKNDTDVRDLLHYYQTLQMLPEVRGTMRYLSNLSDRQNLLQWAERLARATDAGTDDPVMFLYFMGNGAGHAVIVDGAVRNEDGSYTVMVEDNRFFGQELATDVDYRNGMIYSYKLTGQDINPVLEISADGKKAVMTFEGGWTTADGRMFAKYPAFTETLTRYEIITNYEMLKDYFPGEYRPVIDQNPGNGGTTVIDKPIFWFESEDTVIVDPGDGEEEPETPPLDVIVDPEQGGDWEAIPVDPPEDEEEPETPIFDVIIDPGNSREWKTIPIEKENLIPSAAVSVDENMNVVMEYAPATTMAQVEARDQYAAVNPDGEIAGKVAYAEGDIYSSIDTEQADAAVFYPEGAVGLAGNEGEFAITVTRNGGEELAQISGNAIGEISVVPTEDGITAIIPAGTYQVTFIDKDGNETEKSFTTAGGQVSVGSDGAVAVPEVVPVSELPFTDVKANDWFYNAVKYVYENGLMSGTSETTFSPAVTTSRGMITSILWRMEGRPDAAAEAPFKDVAKDAYYAEAIAWAAENGIVSGYGDTFGPDDPITREQLASILFRYAQYKGMNAVTMEENLGHFTDQAKISSYAVSAMNWAVGEGIISGNDDGTLNPKGHAQRSHAAQMLMKFDK